MNIFVILLIVIRNEYIRYIVDCYLVVWNVVMRRSTLRLYCRKAGTMDKWKALRINHSIGTGFT